MFHSQAQAQTLSVLSNAKRGVRRVRTEGPSFSYLSYFPVTARAHVPSPMVGPRIIHSSVGWLRDIRLYGAQLRDLRDDGRIAGRFRATQRPFTMKPRLSIEEF